jgi:hypothetical protein
MIRHPRLCTVLPCLAFLGCDDGAQRGKFVVTGTSSSALTGATGDLTIVQGDPTPLTPQSRGQTPLLYILTLAPGVNATGGGVSHTDGSTTSDWKWQWHTSAGDVEMALSWDRGSDTVKAGDSTFDRQRGNAFLLIREPTGKVSATQLAPANATLDKASALQQIQSALPSNSPAHSLTLR